MRRGGGGGGGGLFIENLSIRKVPRQPKSCRGENFAIIAKFTPHHHLSYKNKKKNKINKINK